MSRSSGVCECMGQVQMHITNYSSLCLMLSYPAPNSLLQVFVQAILQHDTEGCVRAGLELKANNLTHPLPMAVPDARVAECLQQRQMLLELIKLHLEELCGALRLRLLSKCPGEFVHSPPHVSHIILHLLSIQLQEGTWRCVLVSDYNMCYAFSQLIFMYM